MSLIKHVTLQKIVAHDFRYDPRKFVPMHALRTCGNGGVNPLILILACRWISAVSFTQPVLPGE